MTTAISDTGVQFATNNILNIATAVPTTGSYTLGDIVYEKTSNTTQSGWKRLTTGSGHVLGTDWIYFQQGLTASTAQNTTSGTSIDFTGIPSWAKRITVMFNGVSTNGASNIQVQIGAGSIETTGYLSTCFDSTFASSTTGFLVSASVAAGNTRSGLCVICLLGSNVWIESGVVGRTDSATGGYTSGNKTLGGTLDRVRITTVNGTDTFDAGSVNIMWE